MTSTSPNSEACPKCLGCGQVANTVNQEAWKAWEDLSEKARIEAMHSLGLKVITPITCTKCWGVGTALLKTEELQCRIHGHKKEPDPKCCLCAATVEVNHYLKLVKDQNDQIKMIEKNANFAISKVSTMTQIFDQLINLLLKAGIVRKMMVREPEGRVLDKASFVFPTTEGKEFANAVDYCEEQQKNLMAELQKYANPKPPVEKVDKPEDAKL